MNKNKLMWGLCVSAVILIILITYLFVIKPGQNKPEFIGLPFTLWLGVLLTMVLVFLTYIGGKVMPENEEDEL